MIIHRRTAAAVSSLAILGLALLAGGCGSGTNQSECERGLDRVLECVSDISGSPFAFDVSVSEACARVPEALECRDWFAFADCVTSAACADPRGPEECIGIMTRLAINGCFPQPS